MTTLLCPVDFSAHTAPLVRYAAVLARATGATLELLHVVAGRPNEVAAPWRAAREQTATARLRALATDPELIGLQVRTTVRFGDPERVIVAEASALEADVIVIGAHGTTGLTRFLMGGTAEAVLRTAPCPTLLVSPGTGTEQEQPTAGAAIQGAER